MCDQVDKSQEIFWLFIFANVNLLLTATAAATQMEDRCTRLISYYLPYPCLDKSEIRYHTEFLLVVCLPAIIFHILGGALLILYYKTCHPWREVGWEREAHCFGKLGQLGSQLTVETPYWCEDLAYKQTDIQEGDRIEQDNKKENIRHDVKYNLQGYSEDEYSILQEDDTRHQDLQQDGSQYQVVGNVDENNGNALSNWDREIDPLRRSRRLVQVENILLNKEDEVSRL